MILKKLIPFISKYLVEKTYMANKNLVVDSRVLISYNIIIYLKLIIAKYNIKVYFIILYNNFFN